MIKTTISMAFFERFREAGASQEALNAIAPYVDARVPDKSPEQAPGDFCSSGATATYKIAGPRTFVRIDDEHGLVAYVGGASLEEANERARLFTIALGRKMQLNRSLCGCGRMSEDAVCYCPKVSQ